MHIDRWRKTPAGPHSSRWNTITPARTVLVVVHTVTALNRLADILPVFDSDRRVQLVYTVPDASAVTAGVTTYLEQVGAAVIPWQQAITLTFDLAISVHHSGNLHDINAPLAVLSHGIGYTKYLTGNRKPETGNRKPETGNRAAYGLSAQWLTRDGAVVPAAIVLSHQEQLDRLSDTVPAAVSSAVVAGDPCLDRMAASLPLQEFYRAQLGSTHAEKIIVVSSTWGPSSLLARYPNLVAEILAELPSEEFVVALVLHPNTWFAHGPAQIRLWFADCLRAGLRLVPPAWGWQQAVVASTVVVGDHGAVTGYGASIGRPTLLATFPAEDVVGESAIGELGRSARRLDMGRPFRPQLEEAMAEDGGRFALVRELASSVPGEAAEILRRVFYELMDLAEPDRAAVVAPYLVEELVPHRSRVAAWWVESRCVGEGEVAVTRWPADVVARPGQPPRTADCHLVVAFNHPRRDLVGLAGILVVPSSGPPPEKVFGERPACSLVAVQLADDRCRLVRRGSDTLDLVIQDAGPGTDATVYASAVRTFLSGGHRWEDLPARVTVMAGPHRTSVSLTRSG